MPALTQSHGLVGGRLKLWLFLFSLDFLCSLLAVSAVLPVDNSSVCETQAPTVLLTNNEGSAPVSPGLSFMADSWVRQDISLVCV